MSCLRAHSATSQPEEHCNLKNMDHLRSHKAAETSITAVGTALSGSTSTVQSFVITTPTKSNSHKPMCLLLWSFICDAVITRKICKSKVHVHAALQYLPFGLGYLLLHKAFQWQHYPLCHHRLLPLFQQHVKCLQHQSQRRLSPELCMYPYSNIYSTSETARQSPISKSVSENSLFRLCRSQLRNNHFQLQNTQSLRTCTRRSYNHSCCIVWPPG